MIGTNKIKNEICDQNNDYSHIHSKDQCFQNETNVNLMESTLSCNLEVLSLNEVFPSTSEKSIGKLDESMIDVVNMQTTLQINHKENNLALKPTDVFNSKSTTLPMGLNSHILCNQSSNLDNSTSRNTFIVAENEPADLNVYRNHSQRKKNKQTRKLLRHQEKYKSADVDRQVKKLALRGILKENRFPYEFLHDTPQEGTDDVCYGPTANDSSSELYFHKKYRRSDKVVKFNTHVMVIHFTGGECSKIIGQSVETLGKENDQQARNSELRKSYSMFRMQQSAFCS